MIQKLQLLSTELKERGLLFAIKRVLAYFSRPLNEIVGQSGFLLEIKLAALPRLAFWKSISRPKVMPKNELVRKARKFWYENQAGSFDLAGEKITRNDIFVYGGPDPKLTCLVCQKSEWLSRVRQKDSFENHSCKSSKECRELCQKQGDEMWANFHQNFNFSLSCDSDIPAPKMVLIDPAYKENFFAPHADIFQKMLQRRLAFSCQVDAFENPFKVDWSKYDCLFMVNNGRNVKFKRPDIKVILYGHDFWPLSNKGFQLTIDWLQPDVFMAADISHWQNNLRFPTKTKFVFYPLFDSLFFARPNLKDKQFDLLVAGATANSAYKPRAKLAKQISQLIESNNNRYKIEICSSAASNNVFRPGGTIKKSAETGEPIRFLNKWSEYLAGARYVIFGKMEYPSLTHKHFEVLGSGAVPIFPETPDLKFLGIQPFSHYIPLSAVEGDNEKLTHYLDQYDDYRHIAKNAVDWYKENSDRMIFNDFEDAIWQATDRRHSKRLI